MPTAATKSRVLSKRRLFVLAQVLFVGIVATGTAHWVMEENRRGELPPLRQEPLSAEPRYDWPMVVTDQQLLAVLDKAKPRLRGTQPNIGYVDHALRLWGPHAVFQDPECLSGAELRQILLDHPTFVKTWGDAESPLLQLDSDGAAFRTNQGYSSSPHVDHTLAGLAEIGTPLDFSVNTPNGPSTMGALLKGSLKAFSLNQAEYEWSALAFTLFVKPNDGWISSEGQLITFDRIAERIMRQPRSQGVCQGHHRSHALVMLLNIDEQEPILSPEIRGQIIDHLKRTVDLLSEVQDPKGYWDHRWADCEDGTCCASGKEVGPLRKRLIGTGHTLEWMALAPPEVLPPRHVIIDAAQWVVQTVTEMDQATIDENYSFLTHAARAVALWRGHNPVELIGAMEAASGEEGNDGTVE